MNLRNITTATLATASLALSDGTPVEGVKITSKDNIQVRLPESHAFVQADGDPLKIFRRDGTHYKNRTNLTLTVTDAAAPAAAAPAPASTAAAPSANDNVTYSVNGFDFDNLEDAKAEAMDVYDGTTNVEIVATTTKVVGVVGFTAIAA